MRKSAPICFSSKNGYSKYNNNIISATNSAQQISTWEKSSHSSTQEFSHFSQNNHDEKLRYWHINSYGNFKIDNNGIFIVISYKIFYEYSLINNIFCVYYLFVFLALRPIVVVFSQPGSGL
jgi:hypothetical protein